MSAIRRFIIRTAVILCVCMGLQPARAGYPKAFRWAGYLKYNFSKIYENLQNKVPSLNYLFTYPKFSWNNKRVHLSFNGVPFYSRKVIEDYLFQHYSFYCTLGELERMRRFIRIITSGEFLRGVFTKGTIDMLFDHAHARRDNEIVIAYTVQSAWEENPCFSIGICDWRPSCKKRPDGECLFYAYVSFTSVHSTDGIKFLTLINNDLDETEVLMSILFQPTHR